MMRLTRANNIQHLNSDEIQARLRSLQQDDQQLVAAERRLGERLDSVVAVNSAPDIETASLHLAQVQVKRASLQRVRAALLERELDMKARLKGTRFIQIVRDAVAALDADQKASVELRHGIYGLRTLYQRYVLARQHAWGRLTALDAAPDPSTWRTWTESSVKYLVADAVPLPEFRAEVQSDVKRPRLLSLSEWNGQNGLLQAVSSGDGLRRVFDHEPLENLNRIAQALAGNPEMTKVLTNLNGQPSKEPTQIAARQSKPKKPIVKRGRK